MIITQVWSARCFPITNADVHIIGNHICPKHNDIILIYQSIWLNSWVSQFKSEMNSWLMKVKNTVYDMVK